MERNKSMLERIFNSDFAKQWIADRDLEDEKEFYGTERTEQEWKSDLITEFFEQDLKDIVAVLPEVWEAIKERVKDETEEVLSKPEEFEEHIASHFGTQRIEVNFNLSQYLENLEDDLDQTMKLTLVKSAEQESKTA